MVLRLDISFKPTNDKMKVHVLILRLSIIPLFQPQERGEKKIKTENKIKTKIKKQKE